jgi:hypothetical protein
MLESGKMSTYFINDTIINNLIKQDYVFLRVKLFVKNWKGLNTTEYINLNLVNNFIPNVSLFHYQ